MQFFLHSPGSFHWAALAHPDIGTPEEGGVRFSLGTFNTENKIAKEVEAMKAVAG